MTSAKAAATVVVVGSVNMDLVAHAARLPAPGETLIGEAFAGTPGGKGGNQAVAASRLGAEVALIGRVGMRQHGHDLLKALEAERVQVQAIRRDDAAWPGVAVIMVASEGGENAIVVVPGSNADLDTVDVEQGGALLRQAKVVVAQLEVPVPAIQRAFEIAREAGVITVLNAAPAQDLPAALLALSDWLIVNETEALQLARDVALAGDADGITIARATAAHLRTLGPRHVLVTLGGTGAWLLSDEHPDGLHLRAARVDAVDTVGAGDTLVGGLAVGLAEGLVPARAAALGQLAAALAVSRTGVQQAMPHRSELPELPELATLTAFVANGAHSQDGNS
ncbi:ribokinase [Mitsuaria sp. 7]|uniref:ribokinase n=1 Tax=Mitsuaria sp. 7 TaxID=1658665 RepID=UPI00082C125B|nr:ribokinase [Mitsuaria sp. 7]